MTHYLSLQKLASALTAIAMILVGLLAHSPSSQAQVTDPNDLSVVAVGDSLVNGFCVSSDERFTGLLEDWTQINIINEGVNGDETEDVLARLESDVFVHNPDLVLLLVGGNDILNDDPRQEIVDNLREIIETIQAEGAAVLFIGAHGDVFDTDFSREYRDLADETGAYFVPNVLDEVLGRPSLMCDLIHPNEEGHLIMAQEVFPEYQDAINDEFPELELSGSCAPSETEVMVDEQVQWRSWIVGGGGGYDYDWSGSEDLSGGGSLTSIRYESEGEKSASVSVDADNDSATFSCTPSVTVENPPLTGECEVSDEEIFLGDSVEWEVDVEGGSGEYSYDWSGSSGVSGTSSEIEITFDSAGNKNAEVEVTSEPDGESTTISCPDVDVIEPDLVGRCSVDMDIDSSDNEATITWAVGASGGSGDVEYDWDTNFNPDQDTTASTTELEQTFDLSDAGTKSATIDVSAGNQDITLECEADIPQNTDLDDTQNPSFSCELDGSPLETNNTLTWRADADDTATTTFSWSGTDGLSGSSDEVRKTYDSTGLKSGTVDINSEEVSTTLTCQAHIGEEGQVDDGGGGGCFIATAAYGSLLAEEVQVLRDFRDQYLLGHPLGEAVVKLYYATSPPIADAIRESSVAKAAVRQVLYPFVWVSGWFV